MTRPAISAVLPTRNRAHLLPQVLAALAAQTLPHDRFELLVVDDGSTDTTAEVLAQWKGHLPMRVQRQHAAGLACAKNLGTLMARAPIVLFLDDDDVADPDLLTVHLATHIRHPDPGVAVLGHTDLDPRIAREPLMQHVTGAGSQLFSYSWMKRGQWLSFREFWGGRSSCKRSLLVRHGLFRPEFRFGCEDIELGWRLKTHGLRVLYEPRARSTMIRALSVDDMCQRSYRQGRSQALFAQMHPDPEIRAYCEIEAAESGWPRQRLQYGSHLRWTRKLDQLAQAHVEADLPLPDAFQQTLDAAYRQAFSMSRFKGIVDEQFCSPALQPQRIEAMSCLLEMGLPLGIQTTQSVG